MDAEIDINEEYEKIFGTESRENIYAQDDIEYAALRKSIIDAKRQVVSNRSLPFEGIKLSYNVIMVKRRHINKRVFESKLGSRKLMSIIAGIKSYATQELLWTIDSIRNKDEI